MMEVKEEWRPLLRKGFERYSVSTKGNVIGPKGFQLKRHVNRMGYFMVTIHNEKIRVASVHRLIGLTFLAPVPGKNMINHKNGIKTDNRVENLEWVNASENQFHALRLGLVSRNGNAKLTEDQVIEIKSMKGKISAPKLGEKYNVSSTTIYKVWHGVFYKPIPALSKFQNPSSGKETE